MKRKLWALLCAAALLHGAALADGGGQVVQSSCSTMQAGNVWVAYCYAQVYNPTDDVICLEAGSFDLLSGGDRLASGVVEQITPYFLNPGESGYLYDAVVFEPEDGETMPQVTGISYDMHYMTVESGYAAPKLSAQAESFRQENGDYTFEITVRNDTDRPAWGPTVAFGLYSSGGALLYADGRTLESVGILPGNSVVVRFDVARGFTDHWQEYGVSPDEVRAVASFGGGDD